MVDLWIGFFLSVLVQLLIYTVLVYYCSSFLVEIRRLPYYLATGLVCGIFFDYVLGDALGFWSYSLGFGVTFIVLNGFLLWGLFIAEVANLKRLSFLQFGLTCVCIGVISELANVYLRAWEWTIFSNIFLEYVLVIFILYPCFGFFTVLSLQTFTKEQFTALNFLNRPNIGNEV